MEISKHGFAGIMDNINMFYQINQCSLKQMCVKDLV